MTKDDYMKLSKERLAELLAKRDILDLNKPQIVQPLPQVDPTPATFPLCPYGGACTNRFRDCVGCPGPIYYGGSDRVVITDHTEYIKK